MTRRALAPLFLGLALLSAPARALAAPTGADATGQEAERLFEEGKRLIGAGKIAEACRSFEASQKLDPAIGTQFNIADCHEKGGRLATAYRLFVDLRDVLVRVGDARASQADARARALEPRVPRLVFHMPPQKAEKAQLEGLVVTRNDQEVTTAELAGPILVDSGPQRIRVVATNKKPWATSVLATEGSETAVDVPPLADDRQVVVQRTGVSQRNLAFVVGGAGVLALGTSVVLGFVGKKRYDDAIVGCTDTGKQIQCPPGNKSGDAASAQTLGTVATIAFGIGGAAIVTGAILFFTAPKSAKAADAPKTEKASAKLRVLPSFDRSGAGLLLSGVL